LVLYDVAPQLAHLEDASESEARLSTARVILAE
jgi:hypothetical protein